MKLRQDPKTKAAKAIFVDTLAANAYNTKLSDHEFREFVVRSLEQFIAPETIRPAIPTPENVPDNPGFIVHLR